MQKLKSKRENNIIKIIEKCTDLWIIIVSLFSAVFSWFTDDKTIQVSGIIGGLIFSIVLFYFGKEVIIKWIMNILKVHNKEEKEICGRWRIEINYLNRNNEPKERFGELDISLSPAGLAINGNKIRDRFTEETIIEEWVSEYVEVVKNKDNMTIEYAFRIHRPNDREDEYSKVGHVVVSRVEEGKFKGRFVDLLIPSGTNNEDEELRSGNVILQR